MVDGTEDVDAETGDLTVRHKALPSPKLPSADVFAHHNLKHTQPLPFMVSVLLCWSQTQ